MLTQTTKQINTAQLTTNHSSLEHCGNSGFYLSDNRPKAIIQRKTNNTGLPDNLKSGIENLSGHSMDDVKVHYNSSKPAQLNAHAYAQGTDIHVASGQEKHLPHEAWHVVQQKQGRVRPTMQMKSKVNINDEMHLEKEADTMGVKAMQMHSAGKTTTQLVKSNPGKVAQMAGGFWATVGSVGSKLGGAVGGMVGGTVRGGHALYLAATKKGQKNTSPQTIKESMREGVEEGSDVGRSMPGVTLGALGGAVAGGIAGHVIGASAGGLAGGLAGGATGAATGLAVGNRLGNAIGGSIGGIIGSGVGTVVGTAAGAITGYLGGYAGSVVTGIGSGAAIGATIGGARRMKNYAVNSLAKERIHHTSVESSGGNLGIAYSRSPESDHKYGGLDKDDSEYSPPMAISPGPIRRSSSIPHPAMASAASHQPSVTPKKTVIRHIASLVSLRKQGELRLVDNDNRRQPHDTITQHVVGKKMTATLYATDAVKGSATGPNWTWMQGLRKAYPRANIVRGHLLNHDLGGFSIPQNLYPISTKANAKHSEEVEQKVKALLAEQYGQAAFTSDIKPVHYNLNVTENFGAGNPASVNFEGNYGVEGKSTSFSIPSSFLDSGGFGGGKKINPLSGTDWHHGKRRGPDGIEVYNSKISLGKEFDFDDDRDAEKNISLPSRKTTNESLDLIFNAVNRCCFGKIKTWIKDEIAYELHSRNFDTAVKNAVKSSATYEDNSGDVNAVKEIILQVVEEKLVAVKDKFKDDAIGTAEEIIGHALNNLDAIK